MSSFRYLPLLLLLLAPGVSLAQGTPDIPPPPPPRPKVSQPTAAPAPETTRPPVRETPPAAEAAIATVTGTAAAEAAPVPVESARPPRASGRRAVSTSGETGLLRIASADSVAPGLLRLGFALDFFSLDGFIREGDSASRLGGILSVSYAPIEHLELWLNTRASSARNSFSRPSLIQSLGDVGLGLKGSYPVAEIATVGVDAQLTFLSGVGDTSVNFGATELRLRALLTSDLTRATEKLPLRAHLNLGFTLDNSDTLVGDGRTLSRAEQFALGISEFDRFGLGVGIEAPFKYVTPYLEYAFELPLGYLATPGIVVAGSALSPAQAAPQVASTLARPALQRVFPHRLTPGVRITAIPELTLDLAVEIGLTPEAGPGVPAVPAYNVVMLASYPLDPFGEKAGPPLVIPVPVPEVVERASPGARIAGTVKDKATQKPIEGAVITFDRAPPVATTEAGRFESHAMSPGPIRVKISKDGFEPGIASLVLADETSELEVSLNPIVKEGKVRGRVVDDKDAPVAGAKVTLGGESAKSAETGADGTFEIAAGAGPYTLTVEKDDFLSKSRGVELAAGETITADLLIRRRPEETMVEVKDGLIVLRGQVHFITGEARLAPDAATLLDSLVDLLVANREIKRVRVEGHTDNVGSEEANRQLSRARAEAVVEYLVEQGIDRQRLEYEGFGSERPIAPNLTRRGREQNRRVEFHIVEN